MEFCFIILEERTLPKILPISIMISTDQQEIT